MAVPGSIGECTWRGSKIADLSREELEHAFYHVAIEYHRMLEPENCRAMALGHVEMIRRGEVRSR